MLGQDLQTLNKGKAGIDHCRHLTGKDDDVLSCDLWLKERDIFENRLLAESPETLQVIGNRYGITRERTRQLEAKIIGRLRSFLQEDGTDLSDYEIDMSGY